MPDINPAPLPGPNPDTHGLKRRRKRRLRERLIAEYDAYTIAEFCRRHAISERMFFKMQRLGLGPRLMSVGTRKLISIEAAAEWRREREAATELLAKEN
jgi:hypothetical protein